MTKEEKIKKLIDDDIMNYDNYDNIERQLRYILEHGENGYKNYTDEEIDEEYADRIGVS